MRKVNSPVEMESILYKVKPDGIADVWLRANQTKVPETEEKPESYEADEVFCRVSAAAIPEEEIAADFDFWFEQLLNRAEGENADDLGVDVFRQARRKEVSDECHAMICKGTNIQIGEEVKHFSLETEDQLNLFGKQFQLGTGADKLEYHQNGEPCRYYSAEEMQKIITEAIAYVTYHQTYCNSLFQWLESCTKASEVAAIFYGADIPEEYQSIVLKDILAKIASEAK